MSATLINGVFQDSLDFVSSLMSGPLKYIISSVIGVTLLVIIIGLIFLVVKSVRGN